MDKNEVIKKALLIETKERTAFLNDITDPALRAQVAFIINDDEELTSFVLQTAAADVALDKVEFNDLKPGQSINRITIKTLVGKGGMGHVYLGYDETLKRNVAVKTIRPEFLTNENTQKRFIQEAQILSQINHPSICQIYDYIESDAGNLLVLEWIEGETLNNKALDEKTTLNLLASLASALQAAHEKGIIHRDLKPDNIMITHDNQVKVLDFGIAQSVAELNRDHAPVGTLRYMSPEQARGDSVDLYSDIYAFGLIMAELLSDIDCYHYQDTESLLKEVVSARVHLPSDINNNLKSIISQCVHKTAKDRPKASDLVRQIKQHQSQSRSKWQAGIMIAFLGLSFSMVYYFWQKYQGEMAFSDAAVQIDLWHDNQLKYENLPAHDTTDKKHNLANEATNIINQIQNTPHLSQAKKLYLQGTMAYHNRNYSSAITTLGQAFDINPSNQAVTDLYLNALSQNYFSLLAQNITDISSDAYQGSSLEQATAHLKTKLKLINPYHDSSDTKVTPLLSATEFLMVNDFDSAVNAIVTDTTATEGEYAPFYLGGIIRAQQGLQAFYQGNYQQALGIYQQSMDLFETSNNIARSFLDNYYQFCYLSSEILKTHQHLNPQIETQYQNAISLCEQGLIVDPKNQFIMGQLATINWRYGQWLLTHGQSPDSFFEQSLHWGKQSLAISDNADAWTNQGIVYDLIALQKLEKGINPEAEINMALDAYDKVNVLNPDIITDTSGNQLYALNILSQYQVLKGDDTSLSAYKALDLVNAAQNHPKYKKHHSSSIYNNFAYIALLAAFSEFNRHQDPSFWLNHAINFYSDIEHELGNTSAFALSGLAESYWFQAEVVSHDSQQHQQSIIDSLDQAINNIDKALSLTRQYYWMPLSKSKALLLKVKTSLSTDAQADMLLAKSLLNESIKLNPKYADTHLVMSYWNYLELFYSSDPTAQKAHYKQGLASANEALTVNKHTTEALLIKVALTELANKRDLLSSSRESDIQLWLHQAFKLNPHARIWHLPN